MEKEHKYYLFLTKMNLFFLVTLTFYGLSHGFQMDQARTLMSWRRSKMHARTTTTTTTTSATREDETWTENLVFSEESVVGNMENDLIEGGLPGQPSNVMFKQYAGYVSVDEKNGRNLFYYFAEASSGNASSKPLVLWLNGGPGCSSFGFGAMLELGPFGVNPDGKTLYSRRFAWNKAANTLFLESPAGVGFSYSNTTTDYAKSGDKRTAEDAYRFLVNWFKRFPHYKGRDFYIMGESYAGFYVPELADIIVKRNMLPTTTFKIQLKGIMIGNGIMNEETDEKGTLDYLWSHALISDETHRGLLQYCKTFVTDTKMCEYYELKFSDELGYIDPYNIYAPLCSNSKSSSSSSTLKKLKNGYDPCEQQYVNNYLNLPHVQKALHANLTNLPYPWNSCSNLNWTDSPSSMFPIYKRLMASGLRILLFSGDVDAVVSVTSTRYSISAMNLKVIKPWKPWLDDTKEEAAGYMVVYDGLVFATVRGAGHQVPQFQPRRAFALLNMFFANHF